MRTLRNIIATAGLVLFGSLAILGCSPYNVPKDIVNITEKDKPEAEETNVTYKKLRDYKMSPQSSLIVSYASGDFYKTEETAVNGFELPCGHLLRILKVEKDAYKTEGTFALGGELDYPEYWAEDEEWYGFCAGSDKSHQQWQIVVKFIYSKEQQDFADVSLNQEVTHISPSQ